MQQKGLDGEDVVFLVIFLYLFLFFLWYPFVSIEEQNLCQRYAETGRYEEYNVISCPKDSIKDYVICRETEKNCEYVYYHTFFKPIGYCWDHVRDFFSNIFSGAQRKGLLSRLLSGEQQSTEEVKVYPRSGVLNNGSQVDTGDFQTKFRQMMAPNGKIVNVPESEVENALKQGGRLI